MTAFGRRELEGLLAEREGPCVTLTMPTHPVTVDSGEDRTRLRSLLQRAERRLAAPGAGRDAARVLAPVRARVDDGEFWRGRRHGAAFFVAPGFHREFVFEERIQEHVASSSFFHLRPLLPALNQDGRFFVLALSVGAVRLLACTRETVERVATPQVPQGLEAASALDVVPTRSLQYHASSAPGARQAPTYHGHGGYKDVEQERRLQYFREVDRGLAPALRGELVPLVLATVDRHVPLYRQTSTYPALFHGTLSGNPDKLTDAELQQRAWGVIAPALASRSEEVIARFRNEASSGRTMGGVEQCVSAAMDGRIAALLVADRGAAPGRFDPAGRPRVTVHRRARSGDVDLLELAVRATLTHGGEVHAVAADAIPAASPLAALLRF